MRKERKYFKYYEVIKIENLSFNLIIGIISFLANIFSILSYFKNSNEITNYYIKNSQINIEKDYNQSYIDNYYIHQQNKETKNKIISYIFIGLLMIILIFNIFIKLQNFKFIQTGNLFDNLNYNINSLVIIFLNIINNSIFLIICLIILFFFNSIIVFLISKKFLLLSIHIIILLSFGYLAYNIFNFNIDLPIEKNNIPSEDFFIGIQKKITEFTPFILFLYLVYIYWEYIQNFILKDYNMNLTKDKIKIYIFYLLCLLSIIINILFYIYN